MKLITIEFDIDWTPFGFGIITTGRELHVLLFCLHVKLSAGGQRND